MNRNGLRELLGKYLENKEDSATLNTLVVSYDFLVLCTSQRIIGTLPNDVSYDDVLQEGRRGLTEAIATYSPDSGAQFETWAIKLIGQWIRKYLRRCGWAKSARSLEWDMNKAVRTLVEKLGRQPNDAEIAEELELSEEEYAELINAIGANNQVSIDSTIESEDDSDGLVAADIISGGDDVYDTVVKKQQARVIVDLINDLPEHLKQVGNLLLEGNTVSDIAKELDLSVKIATAHVNAVRRRLRLALSKGSNGELFSSWLDNIEYKKKIRKTGGRRLLERK